MLKTIDEYRLHLRSLRADDAATVALEVDYLLAHCCGESRGWVLAQRDQTLSPRVKQRLEACMPRFEAGYPLAYVLGEQAFMDLDYEVTEATLIPRPDTGSLVSWVLEHHSNDAVLRVADLGTGSGTIAVMLAHARPNWDVTATDISSDALAVCERNAKRAGVSLCCLEGSWCTPLKGRYDLIISNPPYLSEDDPHLADLIHEPLGALVSKDEGLADLRHIILQAPGYLRESGVLVLEHGLSQSGAVRELFDKSLWDAVATHQDIAGRDRFTVARMRSANERS